MKIDTKKLREAYSVIEHVDSHAGILASQFVQIHCGKAGMKMSLSGLAFAEATLPGNGLSLSFFGDRRVLGAFLSTARGATVDFIPGKGELVLKSGRSRAILPTIDNVTGYNHWNGQGTKLKVSDSLRRELGGMSHYAPVTAAADHLSAVYLVKGYGILATDQFVMAACIDPTISVTFPLPVVLSGLIETAKVPMIELDAKQGAAIRFDCGYIYQSISTRCLKEYPLKTLTDLINGHLKHKTIVTFKAGHLRDGLQYLKSFVFGSDLGVMVHCRGGIGNLISLDLEMPQGKIHKGLEAMVATASDLKWPLARILPWVEHVADADDEAEISVGFQDHCNSFRASVAKKKWVLLIAETE